MVDVVVGIIFGDCVGRIVDVNILVFYDINVGVLSKIYFEGVCFDLGESDFYVFF